jgi:recombination protein RecA
MEIKMGRKKKVSNTSETDTQVVSVISEKKEKLNSLLRDINKKFGGDAVHFGNEEKTWEKIPFGIHALDELTGGGIPKGKFTTIWGSQGCGKTSVAYSLVANAQKQGLTVYYIALEAFDPDRAKLFGVDVENLVIGRFPRAEQSLDTIIQLAKEKAVDLIILDSIQALSPKGEQVEGKSEKDKSLEDDTMALVARKLSQFFRMAVDSVHRGNVAVLLIGQTRTSVGFIAFDQLSGGNALKHYSKLILHMRRGQKGDAPTEKYKDEEGKTQHLVIGFDSVIEVDKCQVTGCKPELTKIHLPYFFDKGYKNE